MDSQCRYCGGVFPTSGFYKGDLRGCKLCVRANVKANRAKNIEYYQSYDRGRGRTEERKKKVRDHHKKMVKVPEWKAKRWQEKKDWIERNPEKRAAHILVGNSIRDGKLQKGKCEVCGKKQVHAHHDDYSRPLEVRWFCSKHHGEFHRKD